MQIINESMSDYLTNNAFGASDLKNIEVDVSRYFLNKRASRSQNFGTEFHLYMEDENKFFETYKPVPKINGATKEGKAQKAMLEEKGMLRVTNEEMFTLSRMKDAAANHPMVRDIYGFEVNEREPSVYATDAYGLKLKCRPDVLEYGETVIDWKTTKDATYNSFIYDFKKYGYDLTAAHYITTCQVNSVLFVAVENCQPYGCAVYRVDKEDITDAMYMRLDKARAKAMKIQSLGHDFYACLKEFNLKYYDDGKGFKP